MQPTICPANSELEFVFGSTFFANLEYGGLIGGTQNSQANLYSLPFTGVSGLTCVDINNDGSTDCVAISLTGTTLVFLMTYSGSCIRVFNQPNTVTLPVTTIGGAYGFAFFSATRPSVIMALSASPGSTDLIIAQDWTGPLTPLGGGNLTQIQYAITALDPITDRYVALQTQGNNQAVVATQTCSLNQIASDTSGTAYNYGLCLSNLTTFEASLSSCQTILTN